jgi:hypothetical protein
MRFSFMARRLFEAVSEPPERSRASRLAAETRCRPLGYGNGFSTKATLVILLRLSVLWCL